MTMKLVKMLSLAVLGCMIPTMTYVHAAGQEPAMDKVNEKSSKAIIEEKEETVCNLMSAQEYADQYFQHLNDDDLVVQLPDGGFLSQSVDNQNSSQVLNEDGNVIAEYNVSTDPDSITVKEAKEIVKEWYYQIQNGTYKEGE